MIPIPNRRKTSNCVPGTLMYRLKPYIIRYDRFVANLKTIDKHRLYVEAKYWLRLLNHLRDFIVAKFRLFVRFIRFTVLPYLWLKWYEWQSWRLRNQESKKNTKPFEYRWWVKDIERILSRKSSHGLLKHPLLTRTAVKYRKYFEYRVEESTGR